MVEIIKDIKKELRANMNGIASKAMRDAGMPYHVIWGIELPRLRSIAAQFPHDRRLAQELWNENVRESRLLAILLTPGGEFLPEVADIWAQEFRTTEEASLMSMELIYPQKWATSFAFEQIARGNYLPSLCGWLTICRLLREGGKLMERSEQELRDHAASIGADAPLPLRKAVQATMLELKN